VRAARRDGRTAGHLSLKIKGGTVVKRPARLTVLTMSATFFTLLLLMAFGLSFAAGSVPVNPPTAVASADPTTGEAPLYVEFSAWGSSDDVAISSWFWTFGDGTSASGAYPSHTYDTPGTYEAVLTVEDDDDNWDTDSVWITVTEASGPANDDFADAVELTGLSGDMYGCNIGATREENEPFDLSENTVWFFWTAPESNRMYLQMTGPDPADLDTLLAVYSGGGLASLEQIAWQNQGGEGSLSAVAFDAQQGTTYYIQIGGNDTGNEGSFTLSWYLAQKPAITSSDKTTFTVGTDNSFTVTATGRPAPLLSPSDYSYLGLTFTDNGDGTATLAGNPKAGTGGTHSIYISATNSEGGATQDFSLTINEDAYVSNQTPGPGSHDVVAGQAERLSVTKGGFPTPQAQWQRSTDGGATWADIADATQTVYEIDPVTTEMDGYRFRCALTNGIGAGATSGPVELRVVAPAGIATPPQPQTAIVGNPATFTVVASGFPADSIRYQWQLSTSSGRKWADIPGATEASYQTPLTTFAMSGYLYRVTVWNDWGYETSGAAALTVRGASTDVAVAQSGVYDPAAKTITWTWTVTNNGDEMAQGLQLKSTLANGTKFSGIDLGGASAATYKVGGRTVTVKLPDLAPGQSAYVVVTALVTRATGSVTNTVVLTSTSTDPVQANNSDTDSVPLN
jgi:PKD repeat protein